MRKKTLIILVLLIVLVSILGVSYASWLFTGRQKDFNTLGSKCFELTMMNESEGITLDKTYPISDEEGLSTTGYTFTIKNTCNTYATYEVNLEDMLVEEKRLSGEYIKVSINDGSPINLKELEEKEPTIEESDKAYELTSGSLGPEEETTYTIKLWMDESTPALEETMNATFLSKVSIEAGYIPEENLENEILLNVSSLTESLNNKSEIFEITGTSTNYNLIEYSLDNSHWNRIESPSKNVTITQEFTEEKTYTFYVRDEVGNIKSIEIETEKLDKTVPEINITPTDNQESIELSITITDEKSNYIEYAITESKEEPTEWKEYTGEVTYTVVENKNYYIWTKDGAGNVTYQIYSASTIDTKAPELTISNTLTDWGTSDTITIQATDDVIGISGISISTSEDAYNWEVVENTLSYETTKEIEENGTYYISVRDAYGHITTKSIVIDKIDFTAPAASFTLVVDEQNIIIDASSSNDKDSGIKSYEYSLNETHWYVGSENYTFVDLEIGEYTVFVRVTDNSGRATIAEQETIIVYKEALLHGTDPVISGNLIPVTLSENGIVTKASLGSEWYDYETKNWANAVILTDESLNEDYEVGDNIAEMDIESYFVWIPRYRYQIFDTGAYSSNGTIQDAVQTIQVVFENKDTPVSSGTTVGNWLTHPAFTSFDSNGMWVGKFETGYKEAADSYDAEHDVNDSSKVIIKDNVWSWRRINNANAFYTSYNYQRDLDSHMMKNTEWGAVAYLQHSIYGSQASVRINNNSDYVTGYAANSEPTCGYTASLETCNIFCYDDTCNTAYPNSVSASTTGNVTGIFDMSGGAWDNVMGVIVDSSGNPMSGVNASMNSGFKGTYSQGGSNTTGYDWPERKYYDLYAASTTFYGYNNRILGDATGETGPFGAVKYNTRSSLANSWYEDYAYFAFTSGPWFCRGNDLAHGKGSGIFAFNATYGNASENGAFRIVLSPI